MKKYVVILLALVLMVLPFIPVARASDFQDLYTYSITNTASTSLATNVAVTTIVPGKDRILGFIVCPITPGSGTVVAGLYDAITNGTMIASRLFGEEGSVNTATAGRMFPYPKPLSYGLSVDQGALTTVTIYYEKRVN